MNQPISNRITYPLGWGRGIGHGISGGLEGKAWKFQGSIKKEVEIPGVLKKNYIMQNFHGSWFVTLEFPRGVTQICRISRGKSVFPPEFHGLK